MQNIPINAAANISGHIVDVFNHLNTHLHRYNFESLVFKNNIQIIGGIDRNKKKLKDIYTSSDGLNWTLLANDLEFKDDIKYVQRAFCLNDKM